VNPVNAADADAATLAAVLGTLETVILGKPGQIRLCLACLMARGHLLIEDVPGVGKTTLAHALAHILGLVWQRVQFTSDLLPADIIGVSIFDRASQRFNFRQGPIFTQLLLADEVNRASPRTQSALLEAMEERQVSADGTTYPLPEPFFVVATQNPHEQLGTFALPESQLDRFLMRVTLGYPDSAHERELLRGGERRELLSRIAPALSAAAVLRGWPLEIGEAAFSSAGGEARIPGLDASLRIGAVQGGRQRTSVIIAPVRVSYVASERGGPGAPPIGTTTKRRVAADNKSAASIGLTHDFSKRAGSLSIDGRAETVEDVLKVMSGLGRPMNHGWELTGPASGMLNYQWDNAAATKAWSGHVDVNKGRLQVAGLN